MKKFSGFVLVSFMINGQLFAADFRPINSFKNAGLNRLSIEATKILKNKKLVDILQASSGNNNNVSKFSFTRKSTEKDLGTIKQFNIKYQGVYADDEMGTTAKEIPVANAKAVINALFVQTDFNNFEDDQKVVLQKTYNDLLTTLNNNTNRMTDRTLKFFEADHSDEDGSWGVIDIVDTKNNEIVSLRLGYSGT